jgi:hypothetical protein
MSTLLSRSEIVGLLDALAADLQGRGHRGDLFLVGGAAMALAYDTRRATRDLDGVFEPKQIVYEAAARVAEARGLPEDWLNDAVKGFLPGSDPDAQVLFDKPGLAVRVASPRYILAMKLLASRVERDEDDIRALYGLCGFTTAAEGLALVEAMYPARPIAAKVQFLLEEMFPSDSE